MTNNFIDNYVDVAERIRMLKDKYPDATLQPLHLDRPYWIEEVPNIGLRLVYVAACYRTPDDARPGIGVAWEPLPGLTPFTKGSELMVAETSAWGRAIVAALAADTQRIASADEVRNRQQPAAAQGNVVPLQPKPVTKTAAAAPAATKTASEAQQRYIAVLRKQTKADDAMIVSLAGAPLDKLDGQQARKLIEDLLAIKNGTGTLVYDDNGKATVSHRGDEA